MKWLKRYIPHPIQRSQSGQALIILALGFIGLLSFVGLVTDVSIMLVRHNQLVRAVDSAALNAANQMRSDRSFAEVGVAARMMIEMHGFDSNEVLVETCASSGGGDTYLCSEQNRFRKLVRVGATVMSPTVFLKLIGIEDFELSAISTSETAVLDVVMMMDVSESMLLDTTYNDWSQIGFGKVYVPPVLFNSAGRGIYEREQAAGTFNGTTARGSIPGLFPNGYNDPNDDYDEYIQFPATDLFGDVGNLARVYPDEVNARLWFLDDGDTSGAGTASKFYKVRSFNYPGTATTPPASTFGVVHAPREACRVRFWPYSTRRPVDDSLRTLTGYSALWEGDNLNNASTKWGGFIPTYDFYGCCNDPSAGGAFAYTDDGIGSTSGTWTSTGINYAATQGDNQFFDLICQPFKQARDATRAFLATLDFERGDRVALVTFDRGAFLIDPDGAQGGTDYPFGVKCARDPDLVAGRTTFSHMMASFCRASLTLMAHVGVRAEPNFYDWNEFGGGWIHFADGLNEAGDSDPVDYYREGGATPSSGYDANDRAFNQYPVNNNCPMFDAALPGIFSRYSLSKWDMGNAAYYGTIQSGAEGLARIMTPPLTAGLTIDQGYDLRASCRGTNIGAGLRESNNALLDPATTRRAGAVWVIVMLGDGAAGASDPVRANGRQLIEADPFYDRGVNSAAWASWNGVNNLSRYGAPGEYGAFGLCPIGNGMPNNGAELLDTLEFPQRFPYCSDESPEVRHFCEPASDDSRNVGKQCFGQGASVLGMGFAPGSKDLDYACYADTGLPADALPSESEGDYNVRRGNIYDVDIGPAGNGVCDPLYDVDDYSRDWADFVGLSRSGGDEQLPTIFTIGFGLDFPNNAPADGPGPIADNVEDYLGEELLRYIADVGDNFEIDTDYQQDWLDDQVLNGEPTDGYGSRGACEDPASAGGVIQPLPPTQDCGNYYNAPDQSRLQLVFDDIASRMFTRLAP